MDNILKDIYTSFNDKITVKQKRPGIYQLYLPLFHEDGDMVDIFLEERGGQYYLNDFGLTLQRLSYTYDIDTENKEAILKRIVCENGLTEEDGNIFMATSRENIFTDIMHVTHAYTKIGSMKYFKREVIESLFFEMIDEFVESELQEFNPVKNVFPISERTDLAVDYQFTPNGKPVYMFGVKDVNKARLTTISCLEFQKANLSFTSLVVNDDYDKLPKNDRSRLTNACDKQFTSLNEFKASVKTFLIRERLH